MWRPRNSCGGRLIAKILMTTIQENLCGLLHVPLGFGTKFTQIVIIKIFAINIPPQPFLGRHLGFHIFFPIAFLGIAHFFNSWAVFGLDFSSFCNCILQNWHIAINDCCYLSPFFLYVGRCEEASCKQQ